MNKQKKMEKNRKPNVIYLPKREHEPWQQWK